MVAVSLPDMVTSS
jgi:hypothetical protein